MTTPRDRLVFPLDVPRLDEASVWIDRLREHVGVFKVGLELFVAEGPAAIDRVHAAGATCFLDLKLHDIPATMAGAVRAAAERGVAYLTIHASAGPSALAACADAVRGSETRLLAVTALTSLDASELSQLGLPAASEVVARYGALSWAAGLRGLVCSPHEVAMLRAAYGPELILMVPGVRPAGAADGDQKRVASPEVAIADGADFLVVGRPIRHAPDPRRAADDIVASIERGLALRGGLS